MAGVAGFEPTMTESKSVALPLGYTPMFNKKPINNGSNICNHRLRLLLDVRTLSLQQQFIALKKWWWGADSNCRTRRSGFTVRRV